MRFSLSLILVLLFCIAPATASIACGTEACSWCTQNNGHVRIQLHNSAGFSHSGGDITIDGVYPASLTEVIYDDSEREYVGQIPAGYHSLRLTATGYSEISDTIQVCAGKVTNADFSPTKSVSLGKTGINTGAVKVTTTITTAAASSGGSSKSGGAFGNVPLPTTTVPSSGGSSAVPAVPAGQQTFATAQPDTLGSLSVKTEPAGAFIFIDGVQRGVTPATIPGITAGTHTLLLKLDGYQDISTPVTISAGKTQEYSSAMAKVAATTEATTAAAATPETTVTPKKSPGFAFIAALAGLGAVLCLRKIRS
ncbi:MULTISPECIES: PEGA domain-containing protein [unclassified Methanoregula]|uniref:PEGA domain-containing protein n=1 Tax=unclassified Methanoregula TaxID=2649730 RepID=UPI0009D02C19|nr:MULTISPECIES: PEGA domain-containing protein [unclassified Methanoregula]OPX63116.1 MAG: PEGA domain protein [Methanoregula sp. PtaB.Bin085]OPY36327.1 MAG: PEGA domain protein [Methanoregula sp. PtaU1.Bin006]